MTFAFCTAALVSLSVTLGCGRIGYDLLSGIDEDAGIADADPKQLGDAGTQAAIKLAGGWYHMCAISDGTAVCWGDNTDGQLGVAGALQVKPTPVLGLPGPAEEITAAEKHSCALVDGNAYCWGSDADGRLGTGSGGTMQPPSLVGGLAANSVTSISAGHTFTCAVSSGAVYCWGANGAGQLGTGNNMASPTPMPVLGIPGGAQVKTVDSGEDHACALLTDGAIYCWGHDDNGALGAGVGSTVSAVEVQTITNASLISIAGWHACALENGTPYCWGTAGNGELGNGMNTNSDTPVLLPLLPDEVTDLACAGGPADGDATCAIRLGVLSCWGNNQFGRLGDGTTTASNVPLPVAGIPTAAVTVVGGMDHFCSALDDASVWCWGRGGEGQLGDGGQASSLKPVQVFF